MRAGRGLSRAGMALAWMVVAVAGARADGLVDGSDPERIASVLRGFGSARVETNASGNPLISGRADGKAYRVLFYGCKDGKDCTSIGFWAYWSKEVPFDALNGWNAKTRYGKVYRDADKDVVLEYDVNLIKGVSEATLESDAELWVTLMSNAAKELSLP